MKRYFPLMTVLVLVLSACTIRLDVGVTVNEDESGTFSLFMGFDEEFQQLMEQGGGEGFDMTEGLEDVPEGWTVEDVVEDGFEGVRITTDFQDFEELDQKLGELGEGLVQAQLALENGSALGWGLTGKVIALVPE